MLETTIGSISYLLLSSLSGLKGLMELTLPFLVFKPNGSKDCNVGTFFDAIFFFFKMKTRGKLCWTRLKARPLHDLEGLNHCL